MLVAPAGTDSHAAPPDRRRRAGIAERSSASAREQRDGRAGVAVRPVGKRRVPRQILRVAVRRLREIRRGRFESISAPSYPRQQIRAGNRVGALPLISCAAPAFARRIGARALHFNAADAYFRDSRASSCARTLAEARRRTLRQPASTGRVGSFAGRRHSATRLRRPTGPCGSGAFRGRGGRRTGRDIAAAATRVAEGTAGGLRPAHLLFHERRVSASAGGSASVSQGASNSVSRDADERALE